jgi:hypothetical protein
MTCRHPNEYERCEDCPDWDACPILHRIEVTVKRPDCERCPFMRILSKFIYDIQAEEAWQTGDSDGEMVGMRL